MFDIEEDIIKDVQNVIFIERENLSSHSDQKGTEEDTLNEVKVTLMY